MNYSSGMTYKYRRPVSDVNNSFIRNDFANGCYAVNIGHSAATIDVSGNKQYGPEAVRPLWNGVARKADKKHVDLSQSYAKLEIASVRCMTANEAR